MIIGNNAGKIGSESKDPIDKANACLFLASDMGRHVRGQVIQVCNGAFL